MCCEVKLKRLVQLGLTLVCITRRLSRDQSMLAVSSSVMTLGGLSKLKRSPVMSELVERVEY